jgi:hypothetical protein
MAKLHLKVLPIYLWSIKIVSNWLVLGYGRIEILAAKYGEHIK